MATPVQVIAGDLQVNGRIDIAEGMSSPDLSSIATKIDQATGLAQAISTDVNATLVVAQSAILAAASKSQTYTGTSDPPTFMAVDGDFYCNTENGKQWIYDNGWKTSGSTGTVDHSYALSLTFGTRAITYDRTGSNPTPAMAAFGCELREDGALVTPDTFSWICPGAKTLLTGSGAGNTFTPSVASTYDAEKMDNSVLLTVTYNGVKITHAVSLVVIKNLSPMYRGMGDSTSMLAVTGLIVDDSYLCTDSYNSAPVYSVHRYTASGWTTSGVTSAQIMAAMSDYSAVASSTHTNSATLAFINNLVASNAFISRLGTDQLTLSDPGFIKSSNYSAGSAGFQISSDGSAEFNNVTIRGTLNLKNGGYLYAYDGKIMITSSSSGGWGNGLLISSFSNLNAYPNAGDVRTTINGAGGTFSIYSQVCDGAGSYYYSRQSYQSTFSSTSAATTLTNYYDSGRYTELYMAGASTYAYISMKVCQTSYATSSLVMDSRSGSEYAKLSCGTNYVHLTTTAVGIGVSPTYTLDVAGDIHASCRYVPTTTQHGSAIAESTLWSALTASGLLDTVGDKMLIWGWIAGVSVSYAERYDTNNIRIYGGSGTTATYQNISNIATTHETSLAW